MAGKTPEPQDAHRPGVSTRPIVLIVVWALVMMGVIVNVLILFPVYAKVRFQRVIRGCIGNQQQIAMAAGMYADDWDGVLPEVGSYSDPGPFHGKWTPGRDWRAAIRDYVPASSGEIFTCPAIPSIPSPSYAWNRHLSGFREAEVQFPAACPLTWDWVPGKLTAPGIALSAIDSASYWRYYPSGAGVAKEEMTEACSRHGTGLILGFVDGHAQWKRSTLWNSEKDDGVFMPADDQAMPWPPPEQRGVVISMYPQDPMAR